MAALREEIDRIRAAGYAVADEELAEGGRAVAAPIKREGAVVGAVALSGPGYRLSLDRLRGFGPASPARPSASRRSGRLT